MTQRHDPLPTLSRLSRHRSPALFATVVGLVIGLVAAPMVGIVPVAAARADVTVGDWISLDFAFSAGGTQTVTLEGDVVAPAGENLALVDGDTVVLDLNGHSLTIGSDTTRPADYHAAIGVPGGAVLTIRDTGGGGQLTAFGGSYSAAIGGSSDQDTAGSVGEIVIGAGTIVVTGGTYGAGIGGGRTSGAGTILITGGAVTAAGGLYGAGIGGGLQNPVAGTITITGGTVSARGADAAAGIGGGNRGNGITTTITGGSVTAEGNTYAASIGGGRWGDGGEVTLSGGRIIAVGGAYSAGIGGGFYDNRQGLQSLPGTLTVIGTTASGSALNGASGQASGSPPGPAPAFSRISGPKGYYATSGRVDTGGRFTIAFEWFASFDAAGGAPTPATQRASAGGILREPSDPSRVHYDFAGWRADSADGAAWNFASSSSNRDLTLVARWIPVVYGLNYDFAGGTDDNANPRSYTVETEGITLTPPHRDGYDFVGWTGTGLSGTVASVTIPAGSTGDRSYTAHWAIITYTLSYHLGGGTGDPANATNYTVESDAITLAAPYRADYVFDGWSGTGLDEVTNPVTIPTGSFGHRDYTAQWTPVVYTLDYDFGGGTDEGTNPTSYTVESGAITLTTPQRAGYAFLGWSGTGLSGAVGSLTIPAGSVGDRSYTAHWFPVGYALSYDLGGGTDGGANPTSYTVESAGIVLAAPHRTGYVFLGWSGTELTGTVGSVIIPGGSLGDRSYTAHWAVMGFTLSYDLDGGTAGGANPTSYTVESGAIALTTPQRVGYAFLGWTGSGLSGTVESVTIPSGSTGNRSFTAHWALVDYVLSYDLDGGTDDGGNPTDYTVESDAIALTAPHRTGHVFLGWTGTGLSGTVESVTIPNGSTGDRSYLVNWESDTPTNTVLPTVSGGTGLGETLTATPGSWDLSGLSFAYQWYRGSQLITGADFTSYELVTEDLGAIISVEVTAARAGDDRYHPAAVRSAGLSIALGTLAPAPTPTITGTVSGNAAVGTSLTAVPGSWGPGEVDLAYQWYIDDSPVAGAVTSTFTPDATHLGAAITIAVTGTRANYSAETRESSAVTVVPGEFASGGVLTVSGIPGVGHELAVSDESWLPDTATLSYVWLRDGVPIVDATAASYLLGIADEEALVAVAVTVSIPGYHDFVVTTEPVTVDAEPATTPPAPDQSTLTEDARGGVEAARDGNTVTLTVPGVGPDPRWVYVHGFSTPTGLGWHRTVGGAVTVDVAGLGAGTHQLAVLTVSGSLAGWASIDIPALAFTGTADLAPLIGLAVLLVLLGGMVAWLRPLHRRSNQ